MLYVVLITVFLGIWSIWRMTYRLYDRHRERIRRLYSVRFAERDILLIEPSGGICSFDGGAGQWWHILAMVDGEPCIDLYSRGRFNSSMCYREYLPYDVFTERGWRTHNVSRAHPNIVKRYLELKFPDYLLHVPASNS